jgi:hypothetical protein
MTTLFFSPFVSDVNGPVLLGPEVEDDDGKPDMWRTRGGQVRCYSWVKVGSVGESSVGKKKKRDGEEGEYERVKKGRVVPEAGLNLRQQ